MTQQSKEKIMTKKLAATLAAAIAMGAGGVLATPTPANAATSLETRALAVAKSKQGAPYQWGATGPYRFDCSGLTFYSYKRVGWTLPRTAQGQYNKIHHESWRSRRPGDLVFIGYSSHSIYHVGIYAGYWKGKAWAINAPHTGARVRMEPIVDFLGYGSHAYYGHW
jgi:cell wall-associated NlpC family hydrolase